MTTIYGVMRQLEGVDNWTWIEDFPTQAKAEWEASSLSGCFPDELYGVFDDKGMIVAYRDTVIVQVGL